MLAPAGHAPAAYYGQPQKYAPAGYYGQPQKHPDVRVPNGYFREDAPTPPRARPPLHPDLCFPQPVYTTLAASQPAQSPPNYSYAREVSGSAFSGRPAASSHSGVRDPNSYLQTGSDAGRPPAMMAQGSAPQDFSSAHGGVAPSSAAGVWEPLQVSSSPVASSPVRCDKCDEAHETHLCPHFRQARDAHKDAWSEYQAADGSQKKKSDDRECLAPSALQAATVTRMPGDGACLFHSIAHGLYKLGYREDGQRLRQRIANFIEENPDFEVVGTKIGSWIEWDSNNTVAEYVSRLSCGSFWGGGIEMAACAHLFGVDIAVYEEDWGGSYRRISGFLSDVEPNGAVLLLYSGRAHYDALDASYRESTRIDEYRQHGGGPPGRNRHPPTYRRRDDDDDDEDGDDKFCSFM